MSYLLVCLVFYAAIFFCDLLPLFRQHKSPYQWILAAVFAVTLAINVMIGFMGPFVSLNAIFEQIFC